MSDTVNVAFVHGYTAELRMLMQQQVTKLRGSVTVESGLTGKSYNFERLGASDLPTISGRHSATVLLNPVHSRRRVTPTDKGGAIGLDPQDELRMLIQPRNKYAMNHAASANRALDDAIIAAATGASTAVDESDATSSVTLASWSSGTHVVAAGGTGLTFEKVNSVVKLLNLDEVPMDDRSFVISPAGLEDLLAEATSSDFTNFRALQMGMVPPDAVWMGFKWIVSNRLALASTTRTCIAYHKSAIGLGLWQDINVKIDQRADLNYMWQVYAALTFGATRIEEAGVVSVDIVE